MRSTKIAATTGTEAGLRRELAAQAEELTSLREELAQYRGGTQPPPGVPAAEPQASGTGTISLVIQTVDGADASPDFEAGELRQAAMDGDLAAVQRWLGASIDPNTLHELLAG